MHQLSFPWFLRIVFLFPSFYFIFILRRLISIVSYGIICALFRALRTFSWKLRGIQVAPKGKEARVMSIVYRHKASEIGRENDNLNTERLHVLFIWVCALTL